MSFQYQFTGGPTPINLRLLVCGRCLDDLTYQQSLLIIPPDPPVVFNTRPEPYAVDETNWLTTQDDDILTTEGGDLLITSIPNPDDVADTTVLTASLSYSGILSVAYLDLFSGDPASGGTSVLASITGSATRTNIFSQLTADASSVLLNPDVITVTSSCEANVNVSHIGIYSAATAGTLLTSGTVSATTPMVTLNAVVQFNQLGLQIAQV